MKENYAIYKVWDGCKAPSNLEFNGRLRGQRVRTVSADVDALLELADEIDRYVLTPDMHGNIDTRVGKMVPPSVAHEYAMRIREALG